MSVEAIYPMLLSHDKWRTFMERPLPAPRTAEVMLSLADQRASRLGLASLPPAR